MSTTTLEPGTTGSTTTRSAARVAVLAATAAVAAIILAGALDPGYSRRSEAISALASLQSQSAGVMIFGFLCMATALLAAGGVLAATLSGKAARAGAVLVLLAGAATVVVGFARQSCSTLQQACLDRESAGTVSDSHVVHNLVSLVLFVMLVVGGFLLAAGLHRSAAHRHLARRVRLAAVGSLVSMVWFGSGAYGHNGGLVEIVLVLLAYGTPVYVAARVTGRGAQS
jgi:hypothetical membrane protein